MYRNKDQVSRFLFVFGFMLGVTISPAQVIDGVPVRDTPLQDHHIALSKDALLAALHHPDSGVRSAAAHALAAQGEKDAVGSILEALATETFPGARIHLASAAVKLGADEGVVALKSMCGNLSWPAGLRMVAAWSTIVAGREDCLGDVLDVIRLHDDASDALNLLTWFKHAPVREMQEVRNLVRMSLRSNDPGVRMSASSVLRQWGDSSAMEDVRRALAVEDDEIARFVLAKDLKALEEKQADSAGKAK
jgi:HEAT repeat protein